MFYNHFLFNSKGGNFENQRLWTAISFILDAVFAVLSCCLFRLLTFMAII